jgi:hypothetical protein
MRITTNPEVYPVIAQTVNLNLHGLSYLQYKGTKKSLSRKNPSKGMTLKFSPESYIWRANLW